MLVTNLWKKFCEIACHSDWRFLCQFLEIFGGGIDCHAVIFPTRPKHALLVASQVNMLGNPSVSLLAAVRTVMPPLLYAAAHCHPVGQSLGQWFQIQELPKDEEFHLCIEQQSNFSSQRKEDRDPESYGENKSLRPLRYHPHICDVVER